RKASELLSHIPANDSINRFILEKEEFDLMLRENDIQDHYRYQAATTIALQKTVSGGSSIKRILILSLVGVFLMILVSEVSRRRKSEE
ncbi:MAG: hypothetical protein RLZZ543_796, partial [Bacteroidota bacterium]